MASKYPHVEVIGTDLAPAIMNENTVPTSCRFELDDVNRGLVHFYDQMDLVHMRAVGAGVSLRCLLPSLFRSPFVLLCYTLLKCNPQLVSYPKTIRELVRCLKPGGMLLLGEGDVEWHNEDQVTLTAPADPNCPDSTQPGKTWLTQRALGMYNSPSSASIDTVCHLV